MQRLLAPRRTMKKVLDKTLTAQNLFLEAVRLYPLAPALGIICTDDIKITSKNGTEYGLPKGTRLYFPNLVLQRHADFAGGSGDPNVIEPERWNARPSEQPFFTHSTTGHII